MVGYCKDGECMALVYEHMSEGNLEDKLRGASFVRAFGILKYSSTILMSPDDDLVQGKITTLGL